jgi:hypothetical protein
VEIALIVPLRAQVVGFAEGAREYGSDMLTNGLWYADIDSDSDGLANAREIYLFHTSTSTNDTDGDGIGDYQEVMTDKTDPNNNDTTRPVITLIVPSANYFDLWVP